MTYSRSLRPPRQRLSTPSCLLVMGLCGFFSVAHAQEPYSVIYYDFGGDVLSHHGSSASTPTQPCPASADGSIPIGAKACAENFSAAGSFSMAMGVRPIRYLQIDALSIWVLGDFNNWGSRSSTFTCVSGCTNGSVTTQTIGTLSSLFTTGARGVLPLHAGRLLLSGGAGIGWLSTDEHAQPTGNEQLICQTCQHVGGHGPTFIGEIMYMMTQHIGVGFHGRYVKISSSGLTQAGSLSNALDGTTYKDGFFLTGGEVSIRWGTRH